jgi:hypothetical protein
VRLAVSVPLTRSRRKKEKEEIFFRASSSGYSHHHIGEAKIARRGRGFRIAVAAPVIHSTGGADSIAAAAATATIAIASPAPPL